MKTIALVPGSFKPAHAGHYDMIRYYSGLADSVVIMTSDSTSRKSTNGKVVVTAEITKKILDIYCAGLKNVSVVLKKGSPVGNCYKYMEDTEEPTLFILGTSSKGEDKRRWEKAQQYVPEHHEIEVKEYVGGDEMISATDFRDALEEGDTEKVSKFIPTHLTTEQRETVMGILKELV